MALRDVNLMPGAVLQRRLILRHALVWGVTYGAVVALLLAAYLATMQGVASKRRSPMSEEEVRRRIAVTIGQIEQKKEEAERLAFVQDLSRSFGPADVLSHLASIMDPKTWLVSLSTTRDSERGSLLTMQGRAISNARLGATIRAFTTDPMMHDVALGNSSEIRQPSRHGGDVEQLVQFAIEARIKDE
jgi:Tfp pilus assembly protein PilN